MRIVWRVDKLLDRVSGGRIDTRRSMGMSRLFLTTTGRRSGEQREVATFFLPVGAGFAVIPSNVGSDKPPAWWLNLQASPEGSVRVGRASPRPVRAREATTEEVAELWPRFVTAYPMYARYSEMTTRHIPIVILEPR